MLFYITDIDDMSDIPNTYKVAVLSKNKILLNRSNTIDFSMFVPNFKFSDDKMKNKRKYLNQIKDNEEYLVSLFYANNVVDTENSVQSNIVFVCDEDEVEELNFMKIFRKFIRSYYGMKVFKLTYDITLSMIDESEMDSEGRDRYTLKLLELNKKFK